MSNAKEQSQREIVGDELQRGYLSLISLFPLARMQPARASVRLWLCRAGIAFKFTSPLFSTLSSAVYLLQLSLISFSQ